MDLDKLLAVSPGPPAQTALSQQQKSTFKNLIIKYNMFSNTPIDSLADLTAAVNTFVEQRDWEQFHNPKNLSMALIVEAAELVEHFQWLSRQESNTLDQEQHDAVALEMADVLIYLVRMAARMDIDLLEAAQKKLLLNHKKYPVDQVKGRADKYTQYQTKYQRESNP